MRIERALLLGLALASSTATALNLELKPSVHVEVQRDDNIFRAPDQPLPGNAPRVADTLTIVGGGARLVLQESLQALELRGEYDRVGYADLDQLDYDRYVYGAQARLAYASLLKLKLDAGRERRQESFEYRDDVDNSFITVDTASAEASLAVTPRWTLVGRGDHYRTAASRLDSQDYDLTENAAEFGADYRRGNYSTIGLALRQAEGNYRNRVVTPGDGREKKYTQRSLVSRIGYTPSGLSEFKGRLAFTQRTHEDDAVPDFSGFTGSLGYLRRFSGISELQLEAYRDLFYTEDVGANYVENLGLRATYDYRWSAKLAFAIAAERFESSYKGSPGFTVAGEARKDQVASIRVGAEYQPFYRFSVLPQYRYERRGSSSAVNGYDFNVIGIDLAYEYGADSRR